jgi:hypothetical protein
MVRPNRRIPRHLDSGSGAEMDAHPDTVNDEKRPALALMMAAQTGDRKAFDELRALGSEAGIDHAEGWGAAMLLLRLQDRSSPRNLISRASVVDQLAAAARELSEAGDGPIERLLIERVALALVDTRQSDYEHICAVIQADDPREAEPLDRRRDRANRRLLATLKTLEDVRRINRPAVQVNQLNQGNGNVTLIKA